MNILMDYPMKNLLLAIATTSLLAACGGGSSSSSSDAPSGSTTTPITTASGDCQVVNKEILIAEGASCNISAAIKKEYNLFFDGATTCTSGKIVSGSVSLSSPASVNGITIKCK